MRQIRIRPSDIRVGDLLGGRRVMALESTPRGVVVARVGMRTRDLFTNDGLVDISRPDRIAMQALVHASASI